jgi:hypothetical protein
MLSATSFGIGSGQACHSRLVFGFWVKSSKFRVACPTCERVPALLAGALFALEVVGSNRASATRNYSAAIGSEHPATIRIDSRPPQHLDLASLRPSPMQSMTSYKPTYRDEFAPVATPASPSFKIATICDSVNLDFLMTCPVSGESTIYLYPSRGEPTISMRQYHYRETNLPNLRSWRDGRRHRHAQFPARQQVCPKDAPVRPPFRPDAARLTRC